MRTNRTLDLLGVPDLPLESFKKSGGQIKPQGGSGGGSAPTSQTVTQTNIPEYARPYAETMLGQGEALTLSSQPFQAYDQQRFAGFDPMQQQAFQQIAQQQTAPQLTDASGIALTAAQQGLGMQPQAAGLQQQALQYGGLGSQYGALGAMTAPQAQRYGAAAAGIGALGADAAQQGFGAGAQYAQQATSPESMQAYMSPYMQNVVDRQQQEAIRQSNIARQSEQARAVGQGAFGGSRSAIVEAEMQRDLGNRMADIQAQGLQRAFDQAQQAQQFGAGLGLQGLQTGFQGLQTGIAGQQAGMQGIQTGLQGTAQGIQGAQAGLQGVGQATGAGQLGLAGAQTGLQGAGTLGALGGTQFEQQMAITDAQQKYGALQQQQEQQQLDFDYQQFLARQQHPYQQLSFMSDLLRGVPSTQSAMYQYQQQPALAPQLIGAGLGAYGALARKEGGSVHKYREGGQVEAYQEGGNVSPVAMQTMAVQEMPSKLRRLSDSQLAAYARTVGDAITLSAIQSELERRARTRMPGGEPPEVTTAEGIAQRAEAASIGQPRVQMAGGGIVALAPGGVPSTAGTSPADQARIRRGLENRLAIITQYLENPNLPPEERSQLEGAREDISRELVTMEQQQRQGALVDNMGRLQAAERAFYSQGAGTAPPEQEMLERQYREALQQTIDEAQAPATVQLPGMGASIQYPQTPTELPTSGVRESMPAPGTSGPSTRPDGRPMLPPGVMAVTDPYGTPVAQTQGLPSEEPNLVGAQREPFFDPAVGFAPERQALSNLNNQVSSFLGQTESDAKTPIVRRMDDLVRGYGRFSAGVQLDPDIAAAGPFGLFMEQTDEDRAAAQARLRQAGQPTPSPEPAATTGPGETDTPASTPPEAKPEDRPQEERQQQQQPAGQQPAGQQPAGQQIAAPGSGITAGRPAMPSTFEQFREMGSQVQANPEDQALLNDMRQRVEQRMGRAEDQRDAAKYDAILMAGLAMMGGNSMADGIARAAQTGGATYMASRQEAGKALDAAENAEMAFRQYQIELRKGDEKAARDAYNTHITQTLKLYEIDTRRDVGMAQAGATREATLWQRVESAVANDRRVRTAEQAIKDAVNDTRRAEATQAFNTILNQVRREKEAQFGVSAPTVEGAPPPVPTSRDQLQAGTVYNTARGPARWNGERFEPVQ